MIIEFEKLYKAYMEEVNKAQVNGYLQHNTVKTYLLHSGNFEKWCKGDFEPGARNK